MQVGKKKIQGTKGIKGAQGAQGAGMHPTRSYQDEEEVATTKGKGRLVAILLSFVVVLSLVVGGGIYGWMQMRQRDYDTVAGQVSQSSVAKRKSESAPNKAEDNGSSKSDDGLPSISGSAIDNSSASADDVKKALVGLPAGITGKSEGTLDDTVDYKVNQMFDLYGLGLAGTGGILYQRGDYALVCYKGGYTVAVQKSQGIPVALRSADAAFSADTKSKVGSVYTDAKYDTLLGKESLVLDDSLYAQAKEALEK